MSIEGLSMAMSQSKVATDVGLAVFKMAKDTMAQTGEQITDIIESVTEASVNPNIGSNIDIKL